ncbi:DUF2497 domain-containing protein [Mesorhizobium sp. CC13]|uniref:PopZ family protein n=1 Tax=Mesorhizobium sp. CC13 TaxID=3029194 RepID=UPI0032644C45
MAQPSTVQREPSMEEILASIRRIIEDNDTGKRPSIDFEQAKPEPEEVRGERNVIEVEAFRAELQAARPTPEVKAEVAPPAKAAMQDTRAGWPSAEPVKPAATETAAPRIEAAVPSRPVAASWSPSPTRAVEQMEQLAGPAPVAAAAPAPAKLVEQPAAPEQTATKPALISDVAGRQVSAAFGELNGAYAARSRMSFDEIAAEMMRPMLQDWLDNNLPTLVEKLVREEIERIARGAQ